jgi:hypothetical protein
MMVTWVSKHSNKSKLIRFITFNLFVFFVSVYLLTASGVNFYHTDASQLRIEVVNSIIERSDISVTEGIGIRGTDGREYSWVGIGSALLAVPFYIAGKLIGVPHGNAVSIMNQLFGAATVVLIFLFAIPLGYSKRASLLVAFFYGLGTLAWPQAKHPFDHPVETFFVLLSVYFMYFYTVNKKHSRLLFSAFSIGFAFITRPTSILVIPPLFILIVVYYLKKFDLKATVRLIVQDIVLFFIAFLPFLGLSLWYNHYRFGSIFETGYSLMATRAGINFFTGTSLLTGISGFLISPAKGFFYYSPVTMLFFFSIRSFIKKHPGLGVSFIFIMLSYLLFLSKNIYWHGDWAWGPRYILVITPFLIVPIAELFDSDTWRGKNLLRVVVYSILAVSLVIQIAAVSVDFNKYFINLRIEENVKFTVAQGDGIQPIVEPPIETYFNWHRSPLLSQFRFIYEIAGKIKDYKYLEPPENATLVEKIKTEPIINVFDFWWLYEYFKDGSYYGFISALLLVLLAIYSATKIWKTVT